MAVGRKPSNMAGDLVSIKDANICNGSGMVLKNVNLTLRSGEFIYLLGKVGSGKSSIIRTLICEFPFKGGRIECAGWNLGEIRRREIPMLRRDIGVVFQDFQLLMDMTVGENLMFVLGATGWREKQLMEQRTKEVLSMVGLEDKRGKMPHQLSGGEKQRVVIARALLNNPPLILADEPTGNLDPETTDEIMQLLLKIHNEQNQGIIMVTHNVDLTYRYPAKVYICENGELKVKEEPVRIDMDSPILDEIFSL